jgi:chaperonin cofactor prefoldin
VENLKDAQRDLEMVLDEEEPVRYAFGTGTVEVSFEEAKEMVEKDLGRAVAEMAEAEAEAAQKGLLVRMEGLKRTLTGKFGDAIRLD